MPYIPKRNPSKKWIAPRKPFEGMRPNPFYQSEQWKRIRNNHRQSEPLCRHCHQQGKVTPMAHVDHILPINPANPWDFDNVRYGNPVDTANLQSLCLSCHSKKTGAERGVESRG